MNTAQKNHGDYIKNSNNIYMPVPSNVCVPEDNIKPPVPSDVYNVIVEDIEHEIKPSRFKKQDGSPEEDENQYKIKFSITDEGEYKDRWILAWVRNSLRPSPKSKRPSLSKFLLAITKENFGPERKAEVTGDFMNSMIGMQLRVTTNIEKSKDESKEYAVVASFLASK